MSCDCLADRYPEPHGNRISDQSADPFELEIGTLSCELVFVRERLEDRTLPQRKTPILFRMAEATIAEAVELRRDGW